MVKWRLVACITDIGVIYDKVSGFALSDFLLVIMIENRNNT